MANFCDMQRAAAYTLGINTLMHTLVHVYVCVFKNECIHVCFFILTTNVHIQYFVSIHNGLHVVQI